MAVEYKGISEYGGNKTAYLMVAPAEAEVGDLLIAYIGKDDNTAIDTTGAYGEWTMLVNEISDSQTCLYLAWKWADAGDADESVEYTWEDTSSNEEWTGAILCYSGADPDNPIHASDSAFLDSSDTPIAPSVGFTDLAAGSKVFQCFVCDFEDGPRTLPAQLTSRFNIQQGTAVGGAGGDRTILAWTSPTGTNDPGDVWTFEERAHDDNTSTYAVGDTDRTSWGSYLELTHSAISCSSIRFRAQYLVDRINQISVDVYYDDGGGGDWHNIYEGAYAIAEWVEKEIGSTQIVTAMRVKFYNTHVVSYNAFLYEVDFQEVEITEGETGTAVFGIPSSNEWTAATLVIEAEAVVEGLINGYFMQNGSKEEMFGYHMNSVEEFGYYMNS